MTIAGTSRRGRTGAGARGATRPSLVPPALASLLRRRAALLGGLALVIAAAALLATLVSYDPADPSWNTAGDGPAANLLGVFGSHIADLLVQTLGLAAFLLLIVPLVWGWRLMRGSGFGGAAWRVPALIFGVLFAAVALAPLPGLDGWPEGSALGGAVGRLLLVHLTDLFIGFGLVSLAWPITAGATVGAFLLLCALGLSLGEWRGLFRLAGAVLAWLGGGAALLLAAAWRGLAGAGQRLAAFRPRSAEASAAEPAGQRGVVTPALRLRTAPAGAAERPRIVIGVPDPADDIPDGLANASEDADDDALDAFDTADDPPPARGPAAPPAPEPSAESVLGRAARGLSLRRRDRQPSPAAMAPEAPPVSRGRPARQENLVLGPADTYELPPLDLLTLPDTSKRPAAVDPTALERHAAELESVLADFGVRGQIVKVNPGPVVTLYELEPAPGTKSSRVIGLADDIARSMSAVSVRVAVVPGRNVIGIELPNAKREIVLLREVLASEAMERSGAKLGLVLGKDIGGGPVIADLARMPHLLVAGTTGSGKSVAINTMILSLLFRLPPEKVRFIMVDPKMLELSIYEGIPHLLAPVVTDPKKAVVALKWAVREMEDRYRAMSKVGVRNIEGYNQRLREAKARGEVLTRRVQTGFDPDTGKPVFENQPIDLTELPYIVVIVDEMADLMLVAGKDIEATIQRLAQMARAAGIHLIMATQRPSVDVITGTIKANFPTRISFQVTSKIDSRTILGEGGAEQLLGQGDMLYMAGGGRITRVHGPFVSDGEVEDVVRHLKAQGEPSYDDSVLEEQEDAGGGLALGDGEGGSGDDLYDQAVALVAREKKASTSFIQRHLQIGYNRAARLIERMEQEGVVSPANHVGKREVLVGDHSR